MATYRLIARRFLRKYTAGSKTPVYAAASDAATAALEVWKCPWEEASADGAAIFPAHGMEQADGNAAARDSFDAAEWCAEHEDGMHRAYAQMACYRMALPPALVGMRLAALVAAVSSDPYNPLGARLALAVGSTDEIPTTEADAREGAAFAASVAPRREVTGADGNVTWYSTSAEARLAPQGGLVLGRYLFLFVSLEKYDRSRSGWVEGAAALAPEIAIEVEGVADSFADGTEIDCRSEGGREFAVCRGGVMPYSLAEDRFVRSYECLAAGGDLPDAKEWSPQRTDTPGIWKGKTKLLDLKGDARGVKICPSDVLEMQLSGYSKVYERIVAVLGVTRDEVQTGWIPGVAFYYGGNSNTNANALAASTYAGKRMRFGALTYSDLGATDSEDLRTALSTYFTSNAAYLDLARGTATGISFVENVYGIGNPYTKVYSRDLLIFVSGANGINFLGLFRLSGASFFYAAQIGYSGTAALKFIPYTGTDQVQIGDVKYLLTTQDKATSYTSFYQVVNGRLWWFQEWLIMVFNTYCGVTISDGAIRVTQHDPVPYEGTILGISAYAGSHSDSFIVYGDLKSVGGRPCRNLAVISCRSKAPTVWIPSVDGRITPDDYGHYQVNTVWGGSVGRDKFLVTGTFSSLAGGAFAGSAIADSATGTVSGGVEGASSHAAILTGAALSDSVVWFVTGNYVRCFSARDENDLAIPAPTGGEACIGLRNAYAKFAEGKCERVAVTPSAQPGASFCVRKATVSVPSTSDGVTEAATDVSMWRISATAGLVPFATPDGFRAKSVRLEWAGWTGRATPGSMFCVWLKRGEYIAKYPDELLKNPALYDGTAKEVDGWELIGRIDATSEAKCADLGIAELRDRTATLLFLAYVPQDGIDAADPSGDPWGVGVVDADAVNGQVAALDTGWKPDVTLLG